MSGDQFFIKIKRNNNLLVFPQLGKIWSLWLESKELSLFPPMQISFQHSCEDQLQKAEKHLDPDLTYSQHST